jgi:hypothetical protein
MPQVGFEPMILVFKWTKTLHALDRATTAIGKLISFDHIPEDMRQPSAESVNL